MKKEFVWEIQLQVEFTIYRKLAIIKTKTTKQQQKGNAILRNLFFSFFNLHDTIKPNSNYKQLPITSAPQHISIITITITQYHVIYN